MIKAKNVRMKDERVVGKLALARRRVVIIVAVVVVVAIGLFGFLRQMAGGSDALGAKAAVFTVRRDDLTITVTESGSIKAQETTDIICQVETRGIEVVSIVPEGIVITPEDIESGKILCQLNSSELEDRYNQEQISFSTAKADYTEAKEAYLIQQNLNESNVKTGELAVKFARMDFQKYLGQIVANKVMADAERDPNTSVDAISLLADPNKLEGEASQKLRELTGSIRLAEANLERAVYTLQWTERLYQNKYVAETELKKDKLDKQRLEIEKEKAEIALQLFKDYEFPKQVEQLLSDYNEAKRALERTKAEARSKLAQADAKRESTKASFDLQQRQLARLEKEIESCTIRAPSPGIVIYGTSADYRRRREDPIEVGDIVHHGQRIITIPNSNLMGVELSVHESVVDKVRPGLHATITVETFPDQTFHGQVLKVAPLPDPEHFFLSTGTKVYTTQVSIEGVHDFLKPGMSAKVEVLVEQLHDVLIVPIQAVANQGGKKVCYVLASDTPKPREVHTGGFNDTFVEITGGLQEGERVLLNPPRLIEQAGVTESPVTQAPQQDRNSPQGGTELEPGVQPSAQGGSRQDNRGR